MSAPLRDAATGHVDSLAPTRPGWLMLFRKEVLRFWKVAFQTIAAPILTSLLYLLIFSHVLEGRVAVFGGRVGYTAFLIPGLIMMSVITNSYANVVSSFFSSKLMLHLEEMLVAPLTRFGMFGVLGVRLMKGLSDCVPAAVVLTAAPVSPPA